MYVYKNSHQASSGEFYYKLIRKLYLLYLHSLRWLESVPGLWQVHVHQGFKSHKGLRLRQKRRLIATVQVPHQIYIHSETHKTTLKILLSPCIVTINSMWVSITLKDLSICGKECGRLHSSGSQYWWRANFFHFLYIQACCHLGIGKYLKYTLANRNSMAKWWNYSLANIYLLGYMGISTYTHQKINRRYYVFSVRCRASVVHLMYLCCTSFVPLLLLSCAPVLPL